jgi:hypothetical protein
MTSPAAARLRQDAKFLLATHDVVQRQSENLARVAARLKADVARLEEEADELDMLAAAEPFIGRDVRLKRGRKAA